MVVFAGWLNRQQQAAIEYLKTENEILKSQLKGRRVRLRDGDRQRLAEKGRALGRKLLAGVACIVTPETISRGIVGWWREVDVSSTNAGASANSREDSRVDSRTGAQ
jgi:putative transposase